MSTLDEQLANLERAMYFADLQDDDDAFDTAREALDALRESDEYKAIYGDYCK